MISEKIKDQLKSLTDITCDILKHLLADKPDGLYQFISEVNAYQDNSIKLKGIEKLDGVITIIAIYDLGEYIEADTEQTCIYDLLTIIDSLENKSYSFIPPEG
jgi:hypothetical protein